MERLARSDNEPDALRAAVLASEEVITLEQGPRRGEERYSTRRYLHSEEGMFTAADQLHQRADHQLPQERVSALLEERHSTLSHEQRAAVHHATTGEDLALVVGRAGAGKTRLTRAVVDAYSEAGYEVRGAALAGKAAEGLAKETGMEARTLASYELAWSQGRSELTPRDVLLIDEAGMVDVDQMRRVLEHARSHGAKVVLIGDPDQLKPIGAGDALRGLIQAHGAARVDTIRRQAKTWQREASEHLATGRLEPALRAYSEHGAIELNETRQQALDALVMRYFEDRYLAPDQSSMVLAYRNADVRALNERIREIRQASGEFGASVRIKGRDLAEGDRILFLRNDNQGRYVRTLQGEGSGVKNGTLGTLRKAEAHRLEIRLDSGRTVELDPRLYVRLAHGYAATIHKAQGVTVDRAYVLADDIFNRNTTYVALTRHRHQLRLHVDKETFASREDLLRVLAREPRKDLARDHGAPDVSRIELREPLQETWLPPAVAAPVELTSARIEEFSAAVDHLQRWDELKVTSRNLFESRRQLFYNGSLPDLEASIRRLDPQTPANRIPEERAFATIYRDPDAALRSFDEMREVDPATTYQQLRTNPETFGRLQGRDLIVQRTQPREKALATARRTAAGGLERHSQLQELSASHQSARSYLAEAHEIDTARQELAPNREVLLDRLYRQFEGLDPTALESRLPAHQLQVIRALHREDELHLAPLRQEIGKLELAARQAKTAGRTFPPPLRLFKGLPAHQLPREYQSILRIARQVNSLRRATPTRLLTRLAPPQIQMLIVASTIAITTAYRLALGPEDRHAVRRSLGLR